MISNNTVSVIIPTWNRVATLEKAVSSALAQTLPVLEVLVCDDGSSDDSWEVVKAISDPRVRWIDGPHSGLPAIPRNRGIKESRGGWLAFLDSDDEWLPDKLKEQFSLAVTLGCKAACSNAYCLIPGKGVQGILLARDSQRITFQDLLKNNHIITSSCLIHRSLLFNIDGFPDDRELIVGEDLALWLRVSTCTDIAYVAKPLLIYRNDPLSSIRKYGTSYFMQKHRVLQNYKKWLTARQMPQTYYVKTYMQEAHNAVSWVSTVLLRLAVEMKRAIVK